ncbi:hypothetical protein [Sorangium sp. So ce381]|uniref:hypothetical protein n=1 Tax=Sorangium sp. So ce381 TaxID=3133307 RepID=UPI003F5BB7E0
MSADRQECIDRANKPELNRGAQLDGGKFVRILKNDEAPKRFEMDDEPPEFGYRVKPHEWRWEAVELDDGLSVNLESCVNTLRCAVLLHPKSEQFRHAVVIDLAALVDEIGIQIKAVYDPDPDGTQNPCHFNLVPVGKSVQDLKMAIKLWHGRVFAPNRKRPRDTEKAQRERMQYARVFEIHRDVQMPTPPPHTPVFSLLSGDGSQ